MPDHVELIYQSLLDQFHGNLSAALREAAQRLHDGDVYVDMLHATLKQWEAGASLAYLRARTAKGPFPPIDVPPRPIVDPAPDA